MKTKLNPLYYIVFAILAIAIVQVLLGVFFSS